MRVLVKEKGFEFYNTLTGRKDFSESNVPFILDWDFKLVNDVNQYLLIKTIFHWNDDSNTPKSNAERIIDFLEFADSIGKNWKEMDFSDINNWINDLLNRKQKKSTINSKITAIKGLFDWAFERRIIVKNPFIMFNSKEFVMKYNSFQKSSSKTIHSNKPSKVLVKDNFEEDIPTKKELKKFLNELSQEDELMALTLLSTGMRKEELLQITIKMIEEMEEISDGDFYKLYLDARYMNIKFNKSRAIVINRELRNKLIKHINNSENKILKFKENNKEAPTLFISNRGKKYSKDKLNKAFKKASIESGYYRSHKKYIYPHLLRNCFASYYISEKIKKGENNENIYLYISERLGHSNVDVTKKYYIKIVNKIQQHKDLIKYTESFIKDFFYESR